MKKTIVLCSFLLMTVCFTGCGSTDESESKITEKQETTAVIEEHEEVSTAKVQTDNDVTDENEIEVGSEGEKILVAYFSATGTTKRIAETIADETGADLYEITPSQPYSDDDLNYNDDDCRANREQNDKGFRTEISGTVDNFDDYETVFIGYPIWWGEEPRIIDTFIETYDFSGKIAIPFCTSGGSGISTSESNLNNMCPDANWLDGKRFSDSDEVSDWIKELGVK